MSDANQEPRRIILSDYFGFIHIFRAFRLAIQPTKLFLAFCCVLGSYVTGRILDGVWPKSAQPVVLVTADGDQSELDVFVRPEGGGRRGTHQWLDEHRTSAEAKRVGAFKLLLNHFRGTVNSAAASVVHTSPHDLILSFKTLMFGALWLVVFHPVYALIFLTVSLAIWSLFGGALCRAAALHAARDERLDLREALKFSAGKFSSFFAAPLMPLGVMLLFAVTLLIGGLIGAIPAIGEIVVGIFFFLALIAGFVIAFVAIGAIVGFPLMYPTIAVEGSDAFDALSRSFNYIYQRPWRTGFYALVSTGYGAVCLIFVKCFVRLALWAVSLCAGPSMNLGSPYVHSSDGGSTTVGHKLVALWQGPSLIGGTTFWGSFETHNLAHLSWFAQLFFYFWIFTIVGIVAAYLVSFFFCSSTLIYLLLRRETDGEHLDVVYVEVPECPEAPPPGDAPAKKDDKPGDTSLPVIGTP